MSLPDVLAGIRAAERAAGRAPGSVRLVAVTKGHSPDEIRTRILAHAALQPGGFPLAESRGQELRDKAAELSAERPEIEWHFIGPLQLNKVKYLRSVRLVHSLEDVRQARALAEAGAKWGHAPAVLLQVHNGEAQKHGIHPQALRSVYAEVVQTGLDVRGLMVMAPEGDADAARRIFRDTAERAHDLGLPELSMGMSGDYPLAVQAGATLVRVGRSLFS
ncbi:YggS family pyridoxal phosphate-dependent enzyme [Deinococcus sp. YIM 77859]|uniref:YggS family pyridoxal phosphate-dependent enzyme n=1 Tax=Deinococcus sp. YIM 77859 TaxID=1540221 RepID=UPI000555A0E9|nr:YggS family pyridoxal phosphate-dependent enzyme [Deinococcus sp. YIM 77859]